MFKWFRNRDKEELEKLDEDYYDPDDISENDEEEEDSEEIDPIDEDYMNGATYDEMKEKYRGDIEPEGDDVICAEGYDNGYSHRCGRCGFPLAWKEDGNAECWSCDAQYSRMQVFDEMSYDPPLRKCLHCNQPYPHCLSWCDSVPYDEKAKRGYD